MRRQDSGWRDGLLGTFHARHGFPFPASGMNLPMVEYDRGQSAALINYMRRDETLPSGAEVMLAYRAFDGLYDQDGVWLPHFTVRYDERNWSFLVFGHNSPAVQIAGGPGWRPMTERQFVTMLYRIRGRGFPDLAPYGVYLADNRWDPDLEGEALEEAWPCQLMSERRRNYEPPGPVRAAWRNPCVDIDLAVADRDGNLALVVDYKSEHARCNLAGTNMQALSGLQSRVGNRVPALVVRYIPGRPTWTFQVHPLHETSRQFLAFVFGVDDVLARVVGSEWVDLSESQWVSVLKAARDL